MYNVKIFSEVAVMIEVTFVTKREMIEFVNAGLWALFARRAEITLKGETFATAFFGTKGRVVWDFVNDSSLVAS